MRIKTLLSSIGIGLVLVARLAAQAGPPKDATGRCTDGSYTSAKTEARGCLKHGGVKTWFGAAAPSTTNESAAPATPAAPTPTASAAPPAQAGAPAQVSTSPGQVWVNLSSKVYHCRGDRYYGATKR